MPPERLPELVDWLVEAGLRLADEQDLLAGFCQRLIATGVPLARGYMASQVLHPLHDAHGFLWRHGGVAREEYGHRRDRGQEADWNRSPFHHILEEGLDHLRLRLDATLPRGRFPLLDRLRAERCTDYVAFARSFGPGASLGDFEGVISSWTTTRPDGFSAADLQLLQSCATPLALAFKAIAGVGTGRTLMRTYLGHDAGARVLEGAIRRGEPATIDAVLWYSDLAGFTRIADRTPPDHLMALLNAYADALVSVVEGHGGDVLKFMGDGILALFRNDAGARALDAAIAAERAVRELNARRRHDDLPVTDFYLGLHRGQVLYGNIGSRERLDFTVIGPAVNEVARIEAMCRSLDQRVIVSAALAAAVPGRDRLVALGRYALKGVGRAQELFTIDPEILAAG